EDTPPEHTLEITSGLGRHFKCGDGQGCDRAKTSHGKLETNTEQACFHGTGDSLYSYGSRRRAAKSGKKRWSRGAATRSRIDHESCRQSRGNWPLQEAEYLGVYLG